MRRAPVALAALAVLGFGATAAAPAHGVILCPPLSQYVEGTAAPEMWHGTEAQDAFNAVDGDDRLDGAGGDDCLIGGLGADSMLGNLGNDDLTGSDGVDTVDGGPGADNLGGGDGDDTVLGGPDDEELMSGGEGADTLDGGPGADPLFGDGGRDRIAGGEGDDRLFAADLEEDHLDCGPGGGDWASVDPRDHVTGCEQVERLGYNDALLDVRWRATRRGLVITRARVTQLRGDGRIEVEFGRVRRQVDTHGRRTVRVRPLERRFAQGASIEIFVSLGTRKFWKTFELRVRRYGNPRHVTRPFDVRAFCHTAEGEEELASKRCDRVFGRRR